LSPAEQTLLTQTRLAASDVHVPSSVGLVCGTSVGSAVPFVSSGVQAWLLSRHQLPVEQSASTLQPPAGSHVPFVLHAPERHTAPAVAVVHGPVPMP
jgi:hypothetical protein